MEETLLHRRMGTVYITGARGRTAALARDLYGGTVDELFDLHVFGSATLPDIGLPAATWETGAAYVQGAAHD